MAKKQYQLGWLGDPESFRNADNLGLIRLGVRMWRAQRSQGGPYEIKRRGRHETYGQDRKWRAHWRRLRTLLQGSDVGEGWYSRGRKGRTAMVKVVRRERRPTPGGGGVTPSTGTPRVKEAYREVTAQFHVTNLGIFNCRPIAGSSTWSEHSWSNAVDFGGSVSELDKVWRFLDSNRGRLGINWIGWRNDPNHYPGHLHVDFIPNHAGQRPPCA